MTETIDNRVVWSLDGGVATLTLARPDAGNALDLAMASAIREAARRIEQGVVDGDLHIVMLTAQGSSFCVGGDLREFAGAADRAGHVAEVAHALHDTILVFGRTPAPIISVVHGTAAGGGVGLALAADVVLVAKQAKLRLAYTAAGLSPDCGSTWEVPRRVGLARALDLALTNRTITGEEAAQMGLASRAVDAAELSQEASGIVQMLAAGSHGALGQTKLLIRNAIDQPLAEQLDNEVTAIAGLIDAPDGLEGVDAFLNKRAPRFA